jgi:plasmid stabilization system protein ParE
METKLSKLLRLMRREEWKKALSMAAKFPRLGDHHDDIVRGHEACVRPDFYRQIKHDPEALMKIGIAALKERYGTKHA